MRLAPYSRVRLTVFPIYPIVHGCGALAANTIAPSTAADSPGPFLAALPGFAAVPACRNPDVTPLSSMFSVPIAQFCGRRTSRTRDTTPATLSPLNPPCSTLAPFSNLLVPVLATDTQPRRGMSRRRSASPWRLPFLVLFLGAAMLVVRTRRDRRGGRCRRPEEVSHPQLLAADDAKRHVREELPLRDALV